MPIPFHRYHKTCEKLVDEMNMTEIERNEMFVDILQKIQHSKERRILAVSIEDHSSQDMTQLCSALVTLYPEALFFSDDISVSKSTVFLPLNKTREYLGLTTSAVLLDIREGVPLDYFLSISATIAAGGLLVLLMKTSLGDSESLRFHDTQIPTPFFHRYFWHVIKQFAYHWENGVLQRPRFIMQKASISMKTRCHHSGSMMEDEQAAIQADFLAESKGIFTLFSPRGSGKSWLGAQLIAENPQHYILTAPNQNAIEQYHKIDNLQFRAPDALFLTIDDDDRQAETLIIEEAAKMPLAHLERLCRRFNKVLMISSVENYEGTGQGLREKIQDLVPIKHQYHLRHLKRFSEEDSLKQLGDALSFQNLSSQNLAAQDSSFIADFELKSLQLEYYDDQNIAHLRNNLEKLQVLYHLLNQTHYQTNIQDLRRLFDAPSQVFVLAYYQEQLIGAIWAMAEGGLSLALTEAVFNGLRRPKGNLVAQMLTGQSYFPESMLQKSVRISRISVIQPLRRLGIGGALVQFLEEKVHSKVSFMSVSFGLTHHLLQFWESLGYQIAHLGFHLDKTTGLHSAVVLKDLLDVTAKQEWIEQAFKKFKADAALNIQYREYRVEILQILQNRAIKGYFDERDQSVIAAFNNFKRAKYTVENALFREKEAIFD